MKEENKSFSYSYSGALNEELEQYKEKYSPTQTNEKIKMIRKLDNRVDFISTMISISLGLIGTAFLIFSFFILVKEQYSLMFSISCIIAALIIIGSVPFVHSKIHTKIKKHIAPEILSLIDDIEQGQL